jgi:hypothetical protein
MEEIKVNASVLHGARDLRVVRLPGQGKKFPHPKGYPLIKFSSRKNGPFRRLAQMTSE